MCSLILFVVALIIANVQAWVPLLLNGVSRPSRAEGGGTSRRLVTTVRPCLSLSSAASSWPEGDDDVFPAPLVWQISTEKDPELVLFQQQPEEETLLPAAVETWNWCRNFVLSLKLCPWARKSMETANAMQIFVAKQPSDEIVRYVAQEFVNFCYKYPELEAAAIFFCIFVDDDDPNFFIDFYDWYELLEDTWEDEKVIVAPFHPDWQFAGEAPSLQYEKKSPYPTISIVSTRVVEQAGQAATEAIGRHNEALLLSKSPEELQRLWESSIEVLGTFE